MKKLIHLGKTLTRTEQKKIFAGAEKEDELDPGGGGGCVGCQCTHGGGPTYHSCWYTTDPYSLCDRVYPSGCDAIVITPGCTSGDTCITN